MREKVWGRAENDNVRGIGRVGSREVSGGKNQCMNGVVSATAQGLYDTVRRK